MENLTLKELKEISNSFNNNSKTEKDFVVGENYFIRTVTFSFVGKVVAESSRFVSLKSCSWVANTGRFSESMEKGFIDIEDSEVEPYLQESIVDINIASIVDKSKYTHDLPTESK